MVFAGINDKLSIHIKENIDAEFYSFCTNLALDRNWLLGLSLFEWFQRNQAAWNYYVNPWNRSSILLCVNTKGLKAIALTKENRYVNGYNCGYYALLCCCGFLPLSNVRNARPTGCEWNGSLIVGCILIKNHRWGIDTKLSKSMTPVSSSGKSFDWYRSGD